MISKENVMDHEKDAFAVGETKDTDSFLGCGCAERRR
jgi:hypothetical protein